MEGIYHEICVDMLHYNLVLLDLLSKGVSECPQECLGAGVSGQHRGGHGASE